MEKITNEQIFQAISEIQEQNKRHEQKTQEILLQVKKINESLKLDKCLN